MDHPIIRGIARSLSLLAVLAFSSQSAFAGAPTPPPDNKASAFIDWSSLQISLFDLTSSTLTPLTVSLADAVLDTDTSADLSDNTGTIFSVSDPASSSIPLDVYNGITASAAADASFSNPLNYLFNTDAALDAGVPALVTANTFFSGSYTVPVGTPSGLLFLSVGYGLTADVIDTSLYRAAAGVGINVEISGQGSSAAVDAESEIETESGFASIMDASTLSLLVAFEAGDVIDFEAFTYSEVERLSNPIPLPAAFWLFGSGLGLLFIRRNKMI